MNLLHSMTPAVRLLWSHLDRVAAAYLAVTLVTALAGSALSGVAPLALRNLVDTASETGSHQGAMPSDLLLAGMWYLAALCGARAVGELRPCLLGQAEQRIRARLNTRAFAHVLGLPMSWHQQQHSGAVAQMLIQAGLGVQLLLSCLLNGLIPVAVEFTTILFVLSSLDQVSLLVIFGAAASGYCVVLRWGSPQLSRYAGDVARESVEAHTLIADSLPNCETIKCFGAHASVVGRHAGAVRRLAASWGRLHGHKLRMGIATLGVFGCALGASLFTSLDAVSKGSMTVGGLVMTAVCLLQVMRPLEALGSSTREGVHAIAWIRPLLEIERLPTEPDHSLAAPSGQSDASPRRSSAPALRFLDVRFGYGPGRSVLEGLRLEVPPGRTLAIVGESGSGKSTLMRLLLRLYEPQAGCILLDEVPLAEFPPAPLRRMIALIPQDTALLHDTISANIALGDPNASRGAIENACRRARLHDFVMSLPDGYDTLVGERGLTLSGGQRQRVAIARAVFRDASILLVDEATSMLDTATEADVLEALREFSTGRTTVIIAHRLAVAAMADEIAVMSSGRVVERGTHHQLVNAQGVYSRLWQAQQGFQGS